MSESKSTKKKSDPLQNFLIFAAILLVGLYLLEEWRSSTVEEGALLAEGFTKELADDCIVHSSGLDGDLFVISCPNERNISELEKRVKTHLKLKKFILKTSYTYLLCEEGCEPIQAKIGG